MISVSHKSCLLSLRFFFIIYLYSLLFSLVVYLDSCLLCCTSCFLFVLHDSCSFLPHDSHWLMFLMSLACFRLFLVVVVYYCLFLAILPLYSCSLRFLIYRLPSWGFIFVFIYVSWFLYTVRSSRAMSLSFLSYNSRLLLVVVNDSSFSYYLNKLCSFFVIHDSCLLLFFFSFCCLSLIIYYVLQVFSPFFSSSLFVLFVLAVSTLLPWRVYIHIFLIGSSPALARYCLFHLKHSWWLVFIFLFFAAVCCLFCLF